MYSKTLAFTNESDITFQCASDSVEIFVGANSLGKINSSYPVTVYVTVAGNGNKAITMEEIVNNDYLYHNNANRTVIFNQENQNNRLTVSKCNTSNKFSIVGVDDESLGISCQSGECEEYFDISDNLKFKSKMEVTYVNSVAVYRMFVRYSIDVIGQCGTDPLCSTSLFCYKCL